MSFDIDKIPLTLLSNEAKIQNLYPEEQEDVEFFSQLEIDNRFDRFRVCLCQSLASRV